MFNFIVNGINSIFLYRLQERAKGLGVLFAFLIFCTLAIWDDVFKPICDALGVTYIADKLGIIQDTPILTFAAILYLTLIFMIVTFVCLAFKDIVYVLFWTTPLKYIVAFPFALAAVIGAIFKELTTKKTTRREPTLEEQSAFYRSEINKRRTHYETTKPLVTPHFNTYVENSAAAQRLNVVSAELTSIENYLIGYSFKDATWYIMGTQPLPPYVSPYSYGVFQHIVSFTEALKQNHYGALHVPVQKITIQDGQLIVEDTIKVTNIMMLTDIHTLSEDAYTNITAQAKFKLADILLELHVLLYALPAYHRTEYEKEAMNQSNYLSEMKKIPHYDTYHLVYAADIIQYFEKLLKEYPGDEKAQRGYKAYQKLMLR